MPIDTKRIIANALEEMLRNKSIDKITVSSLIEACGVSRQTFYYHFRDLMDVLEWLAQQDAQKLAERSMQAETTHEALHAFLSYAVENHALLRRLLESQRRAQIETILADLVTSYLWEVARHRQLALPEDSAEVEAVIRFSVCGLVGILLTYGDKKDLDQERLIQWMETLLTAIFQSMEKKNGA